MYGVWACGTSSPADLGVNPAKRSIEILHHFAERGDQRRSPADQHVIDPRIQAFCTGRRRQSDNFAKATAHSVAFHGVTYLSRNRETYANRSARSSAARLQHEGPAGNPRPTTYSPKIAPAF
jgi:hypothetical protein